MTLRLGDIAPDFMAQTTHGTFRFHARFPKGFVAKKPYLRVTPQPNK